jgi:hypothetical protein
MPWYWLYRCRQRCSWPEPARSWSLYRTKGEIDEQEAAIARQNAEEGAERARRRGYNASARIAQASESVARTIDEIAREIDAGLLSLGGSSQNDGPALNFLASRKATAIGHCVEPVLPGNAGCLGVSQILRHDQSRDGNPGGQVASQPAAFRSRQPFERRHQAGQTPLVQIINPGA